MAGGNVIIKGVPELRAALLRAATETKEVMRSQIASSGHEMRDEARAQLHRVGATDTGRLEGSTEYRATDAGMGAEVFAPNPEAAAVEFGTAPAGKLAQHFPPPDALEGWAQRHGFPPGGGFLVARKIALRGIRARPWLSIAHTVTSTKFVKDLTDKLNALLSSL